MSPLKKEEIVVGRIIALKYAHVLIPSKSKFITLHGKRNLAGVIKIKDLNMRKLPRIIQVGPL